MGCFQSKAWKADAEGATATTPRTPQTELITKKKSGDDNKKEEEKEKEEIQSAPEPANDPISAPVEPEPTTTTTLNILHFNDVYNAERAPRFVHALKTKLNEISNKNDDNAPRPAVIFSGDAFNPSVLSTLLRGTQMIPVLNECHIDAACLGNHDLDFGLEEFEQLREKCSFPWICSNAREKSTGRNLGGCEEFVILDLGGKGDVKCLVLGLIEADWMATLSAVEPDEILYENYNEYVARRVPEITQEQNDGKPFDLIVAATHMRMNNDYALAQGEGGKLVDLILGGHDHHYEDTVKGERDIRILNSGTDFNDFTVVEVDLPKCMDEKTNENGARPNMTTRTTHIRIPGDGEENPTVLAAVNAAIDESRKCEAKIIGRTKVMLDARFSSIRTKETNVGNFIADLLLSATTDAQIALFNSGALRANAIVPAGEYVLRDVCQIFPYARGSVVLKVSGEQLIQALENGVSKYPSREGRFPCVAGVRFDFDPTKEAGSRILPESVFIRRMPKTNVEEGDDLEVPVRMSYSPSYGLVYVPTTHKHHSPGVIDSTESTDHRGSVIHLHRREGYYDIPYDPIDLESSYTVVTTTYLGDGKDGYDVFKDVPVVHDDENCPILPTVVRNYFIGLDVMSKWTESSSKHRTVLRASNELFKLSSASEKGVDGKGSVSLDPYAICPKVDGRICNVTLKDEMKEGGGMRMKEKEK